MYSTSSSAINDVRTRRQRGMTLLEVIIVLGIIGTIAAGVVLLAQRAFDARNMSELVTSLNGLRVAVKDTYQREAEYPTGTAVTTLTPATLRAATSNQIVARLVQLGKVQADEARNPISNDYFSIFGATLGGTARKGFVVEVNGLSQEQCRALISQVGAYWDYVSVVAAAPSGTYTVSTPATNLSVATSATVLRSLAATSGSIGPDTIATACTSAGAQNGVILGSR